MITIDEQKCTLCGLCISVCVRRILHLEKGSVQITDPALCMYCGHCKAVCPTDAPRFSEGNEEFTTVPSKEEIPSAVPFLRFLRNRRSLRLYQDRPVEKGKLQMLLEAGRFAPTGGNRQACEYVLVSGRKKLDEVRSIAIQKLQEEGKAIQEMVERHHRLRESIPEEMVPRLVYPPVWDRIAAKWKEGVDHLLYHAPALMVIHTKKNLAVTPELDAAMAATQMVLAAETLGLGTCYIGFLISAVENSEDLKKMLQIPTDHRSLVAFTVGYPDVNFLRLVYRNPAKAAWIGEFAE